MKETKLSTVEKQPEHGSQTTVKSEGRDGYVVGYCRPPVEHQFKPGQGGRKKGSRNKLGEDFIQAIAEDFENHGAAVIVRVRQERPTDYLKVVASLLPKDVNITTRSLDDLTDDQLMRKLQIMTEMARPLLAKLPTAIDVTPVGVDVGVTSDSAEK